VNVQRTLTPRPRALALLPGLTIVEVWSSSQMSATMISTNLTSLYDEKSSS
jgi:hypothetical protein